MSVETIVRDQLRANDALQEPIDWDEIVARSETKTVTTSTRQPLRPQGVLVFVAAVVIVILIGLIPLILRSSEEPPPATELTPTPTTIATPTTVVESGPSTTLASAAPPDLEAAALDAVAGAGTMLVRDMFSGGDDGWANRDRLLNRFGDVPEELLSAAEGEVSLELAPLPETRLQEGKVWLASFAHASQAELFISEVVSGYRENGGWFPIAEFEVPGIDGSQGLLGRWLTGRGGPSRFPNATVWFKVDAVVAAVDINFGEDFLAEEWPLDSVFHLASWLHSSLTAQITGQQISGPEAPMATPPSEYELEGIDLLHSFYRAIVSGDMDSAWALVGDIGRPGPGCGEGCQAANWHMNVIAPLFAAMLDPFEATADVLWCSATGTSTIQVYPDEDGFRDAVDVDCIIQINGDPWLEALGINTLVEIDGQVVPGEPIVILPSIPEHPGNRSIEYGLLMLARHAGGSDPETLASVCLFDHENPDVDGLAWSVDTESPLRHSLEGTCREFAGDFDDVAIPIVP